jgi:DNA polymerase III subunit alpha
MTHLTQQKKFAKQRENKCRGFTHLHTHSHYSLLQGLTRIPALVEAAKKDGQTALALTDNGNLYGAIDFYKTCKKNGIKPIIGSDIYIAPRSRHEKEHNIDNHTSRLVLLVKNEEGYRNLLKLVSRSFMEGFYYTPRADHKLIEEYSDGLIAIIPSFAGEPVRALASGSSERAEESYLWHKKVFGENLYSEITMHPEIEGHGEIMQTLIKYSKEKNIPLVAAHDTYYLKPADAIARELVRKIRTGGRLDKELGVSQTDFSFITQEKAIKLFKKLPEALENTQKIADACNLELALGSWVFPNFPIPKNSTHDKELRILTQAGLSSRNMEATDEVKERIDYELGVIADKGYAPYFLVVADLLRHARENNIFTNTRGSAAGSLVSYLCGITTIDPMYYRLPFERFLNPERPSPPDIDMDLADNKRDELIRYAREKYGDEHVAQIGTFGTMMARAAVRDVARALGHSYGMADQIAKMIPFGAQGFPMTIERAMKEAPELKEVYKNDADAREIIDFAKAVEGNARHVGVHAAGVVISPTPVTDFVPIQFDPKGGKTITQFDMHAVENAGLLKFDFLGLKNLSVLADSVVRVKKRLGKEIDIENIKLDDKKTYEMLSRGETLGVFQMGGSGMTSYLKELKPSEIHDISAMVALYRPGPMAFIPEYIERKHNPERVKYIDYRMEEILKPTYGILIYQDDVMTIAVDLAGYSWGEADKFRKAMGKKIPAEMKAQEERFKNGCVENGMKPLVANQLWEMIETFAAYGFNKAHAASYGKLSYQTAYMKANFPVDYMASLLTADAGDVDKISGVVAECKRMGISVLPPDVNESHGQFTVVNIPKTTSSEVPDARRGESGEQGVLRNTVSKTQGPQNDAASTSGQDEAIRFGLHSIKNFGSGVGDSIIEERKNDGPFTSLGNFLSRIKDKNLNRKSVESLIKSGALDAFGERGQMAEHMELLLQYHKEHVSAPENQDTLFGALGASEEETEIRLPTAAPASTRERLAWERELLGLYISGHPLDKHRKKFENQKFDIKATKEKLPNGVQTVIAGLVENNQTILTKNGEKMAFLRIADYSDTVEVVCFPRVLKEYGEILGEPESCVMVKGRMSERNGEMSFVAEAVKKL